MKLRGQGRRGANGGTELGLSAVFDRGEETAKKTQLFAVFRRKKTARARGLHRNLPLKQLDNYNSALHPSNLHTRAVTSVSIV